MTDRTTCTFRVHLDPEYVKVYIARDANARNVRGLSIVSAGQDVTLDFPNSEFRKMTGIINQWIE